MPNIDKGSMGEYHRAEEYLYFNRLVGRRTAARREVLGCLGCQWLRPLAEGEELPVLYLYQLNDCTNLTRGAVYSIMRQLTDAGAVTCELEDIDVEVEGHLPRNLYSPSDTVHGKALMDKLQMPPACDL
ncbi:MAG TPA: hypothetical protein VF733_00470 [Candidatus Saccharimonadales bacterium]